MPKPLELTGKIFGRWTVLERKGSRNNLTRWLCKCECGSLKIVDGRSLSRGGSLSCGCLRQDRLIEKCTTHGKRKTTEYNIHAGMKTRCYNEKSTNFFRYGGRGIKVCDRWLNGDGLRGGFECFIHDVGVRPSLKHSLDRKNNDGNYEKENCHWVIQRIQARNTSRNVNLTHKGKTMCIIDWGKEKGLTRGVINYRLRSGWSVHDALETKAFKKPSGAS